MRIKSNERRAFLEKLPKCPYDKAENCMHSKLKPTSYYPHEVCDYMLVGRCQNTELACRDIWSEKWK